MTPRTLVDGVPLSTVSVLDRGLCYGDGLFESIRFVGSEAPLWSRHMQRLADSCRRLLLPVPSSDTLLDEARAVVRGWASSTVRIAVTRGVGERGYRLPSSPRPMRVVAGFAAPVVSPQNYRDGIRMRLCGLRLGEQPLLAGIKHLNRLEQVLARAEWSDPAIAEGVLCDAGGRVISATMANIFAMVDGVLITPAVDRCGVAGVGRAEVLATCPQAMVGELMLDALHQASEVFLSSSVRGILPVHALDDRHYAPGTLTRQLQAHWRDLGFSMEQAG